MGLSCYSEKGIDYPILTCDKCGRPITEAWGAIVITQKPYRDPIVNISGIYHKGKCDPGNKICPYSEELSRYLRQLVCNLHIGEIVKNGSKRQLVIDIPEPDGFLECRGSKSTWKQEA